MSNWMEAGWLIVLIPYDLKFYSLPLSKIYRCSMFSFFPKPIRYELKGQSEHSGLCSDTRTVLFRGGSRIFPRWGMIFNKLSKIFLTFLFRSTKLIFRALPNHCFATILAKFWNFVRRRQIVEKNRPEKAFLGIFWKIFDQKVAFRLALPLQN